MPHSAFPRLAGPTLALLMISMAPLAWAEQGARAQWQADLDKGYAALAGATADLADTAEAFCDAPDANRRDALESDWLTAYRAWQAVRWVNFGPIEQQSRAWQLQFWPDNKNLVGRKVGVWLQASTPATTATLAEDSVAVQGFPALEYLLFDESMASPGALHEAKACGLLTAISGHLAAITETLHNDWQAFGPHYRDGEGYGDATVHAAMQALETLEDKRLGEPLGLRGSAPNAYRAEAWRSGRSVRLIEATLGGLEETLLPGLRLRLQQDGADAEGNELANELADKLADDLGKARRLAATLPPGIAPQLDAPEGRAGLQDLYLAVSIARQHLNHDIAARLGVVRGFNSSDGD